ncbi:Rossmann-fold NAD(P)-binding domain-containing protein [Pleomorphovibrio marinus]|uniref:hypothetical protein n=1 Tax=Pleomorphovibrio marinus TaxID=2164132 RepID=UPI000E0BDB90|nr:hypothetical protein [Pleomorphovibrio marinus]
MWRLILHNLGAFLVLFATLSGCRQEEERPFSNPIQIDQYFSIKSLIEEKLPHMDGMTLEKQLMVGNNMEQSSEQLNPEDWRRELDIFIHADINKASLANAYHTEESQNRISHILKEGEKGEIKEMNVYKNKDNAIDSVTFVRKKENLFFLSFTEGSLTLEGDTLKSYRINGLQKVWFLPRNQMQVRGTLIP